MNKLSEPRQHHQLPQLYLEAFESPIDAKIWQLRFADRCWFPSSAEKTAKERDYYSTTTEGGGRDQWFDELLRSVETMVAPILAKVRDGRSPATGEEQAALLLFVSTMLFRQPAWHSHIEAALSADAQSVSRALAVGARKNPEKFRSDLRKHSEEAREPKILELTPEDLCREGVLATKHSVFMMATKMSREVALILSLMQWTIFRSEGPNWFITSDFPVGLFDEEVAFYGVGLGSPTVQVTIPLGRHVALVGRHWQVTQHARPAESQYQPWDEVTADSEIVRALNLRSVSAARRCLLTPDRSAPGCAEISAAVMEASDLRLRQALGGDRLKKKVSQVRRRAEGSKGIVIVKSWLGRGAARRDPKIRPIVEAIHSKILLAHADLAGVLLVERGHDKQARPFFGGLWMEGRDGAPLGDLFERLRLQEEQRDVLDDWT